MIMPAVVIFPIEPERALLAAGTVNQSAPSGPRVISFGADDEGGRKLAVGYSDVTPAVVVRPIAPPDAMLVNQSAPSGPPTIDCARAPIEYSVNTVGTASALSASANGLARIIAIRYSQVDLIVFFIEPPKNTIVYVPIIFSIQVTCNMNF